VGGEPATSTGTPTPADDSSRVPPGATTTSSAPQDPAPEPDPAGPPTVPADPLAACSTGQRSMIERGNHPWDWYVARFDADGDGVLCT
jgi:hypothetical protein